MPIQTALNVTAPVQKAFVPLPADVYQVIVKDIEIRETQKYMSKEREEQFLFKLIVLDEGAHRTQYVGAFATQKWFNGGKTGSMAPSKLYLIFQAVYQHYYAKVNLQEWEPGMVNQEAVNDLIGKQIRVTVTLQPNGKNKVTTFMSIKKELKPVTEEELAAKKEASEPPMPEEPDA